MILETEIFKVHPGNQENQSSDNWQEATRNSVDMLRYESKRYLNLKNNKP